MEWTARNAAQGKPSEQEVAKALWAFLQEADALMKDDWKDKKAYDLAEAHYQLKRWL